MSKVNVGKITIGEGMPKICVPIVGETADEIVAEAEYCKSLPIDLVEWRVDCCSQAFLQTWLGDTMRSLRKVLKDIPILFTFRSKKEGGKRAITEEQYLDMISFVARAAYVDLIDIELSMGEDIVRRCVELIHTENLPVLISSHDFEKTPSIEEMRARLEKMQELGGEILKLAVMPQSRRDVLDLLAVTEELSGRGDMSPLVTMAMSDLGVITRVAGESFGSVMSFGAAKNASAPGQLPVEELRQVLETLKKG
ncbi:MAG: type I 3-dehydroquinate dehydratase [Faecalimonas sp.]|nr:type I 3-dehydroquinate dehydratase [Faecalimonas sp.]